MKKQYRYFVGIDISKGKLDVCLRSAEEELALFQVANTPSGVSGLLKRIAKGKGCADLVDVLFCFEHTGVYVNRLVQGLHQAKCAVWMESPLRIKQAIGHLSRGKDDQTDARRIADFAYRHADRVRIHKPKRPVVKQLSHLLSMRNKLLKLQASIATSHVEKALFDAGNELKEVLHFGSKSLKAIKKDIAEIEAKIRGLIREDQPLNKLFNYVTSVRGIGLINGAYFLVVTNEFTSFTDPKAYATHAGVAPFPNRSGRVVKPDRVSHKANKDIKKLLTMSVTCLIGYPGEFQTYYQRKTAEGKHPNSVINAMRNKLIRHVFAVVREQREYQYSYPNPLD